MAKKNFRRDDLFDDDGSNAPQSSWQEVDSQIFGSSDILDSLATADARRERIKAVDIFSIEPDMSQPRRTMPSGVRRSWDGTAQGVADMFSNWLAAAERERGSLFDLGAFLINADTERSDEGSLPYNPGPVELSLLEVVTLAASINRDGLTNPITVVPSGKAGRYNLETGERRWLAYHLLFLWFDGTDGKPDEQERWSRIPSREVNSLSVWRQASENNVRADLNAIAKSRQYAVLMMDLLSEKFKPISQFNTDREFYAQVANARVPSGKGEELLAAMGVTNRSALSRYRRLLELPDEIWEGGDDRNMSDEQLYNLANMARISPQKALERYYEIVAGRNISSRSEDYGPGTKRHFSQLTRAIKLAGRGRDSHNNKALKSMRELREWLDLQEERIRKFSSDQADK